MRQLDESHRAQVRTPPGGDTFDTFNAVLPAGTIVGAVVIVAFPMAAMFSAQPLNMGVIGLMRLTGGAAVFLSL